MKWDAPFQWGDKTEITFQNLKKALITQPILMIPLDNAPYRVEVDSSDHALGGVLSQYDGEKW